MTDPAPRPRKRWRRRLVIFGSFFLILVIAGAAGLGIYLKISVDRRLAAAIAEADRDDPNWRRSSAGELPQTVFQSIPGEFGSLP